MTDSVESKLRKNTFCGIFQENAQTARALDVHRIVFTNLGLKHEDVRCVQLELGVKKFYIKLQTEEKLREVLARRSIDYVLQDGTTTTVKLEDAGQGLVTVRVFRLPPEVDNSIVRNAFSRYGNVLEVYEEKWAHYEGAGLPNGVRGVKMEIQNGLNIPSWLKIKGVEVKADYFGQIETCRKCHNRGHNLYDCPQRAINKPGGRRWEDNQANNNKNEPKAKQPSEPTQPAKPSQASSSASVKGQTSGEGGITVPQQEQPAAVSAATPVHSAAGKASKPAEGTPAPTPKHTAPAPSAKPANQAQPAETTATAATSAATPSHATAERRLVKLAAATATTPSHAAAEQLEAAQPDDTQEAIDDIVEYLRGEDLNADEDDVRQHVLEGGSFDEYLQKVNDRLLQSEVTRVATTPLREKRKISDGSEDESTKCLKI